MSLNAAIGCFVVSYTLALFLIIAFGGEVREIFSTNSQLQNNQSQFFEVLVRRPLRQKHQFYLYNITSGERFLSSNDTIDEVGPFVYYDENSNVTVESDGCLMSLSLQNLQFSLNESVADESVFLYTLNLQSIKNLSSGSTFLKSQERNLVHKTTARDFLRQVVDGLSLGTTGVDTFPKIKKKHDEQSLFKAVLDDVNSNYLRYLRNEICLRLFRVFPFVNPPVQTPARLFQKTPCECLTITPDGAENMSRKHAGYPDMSITKYILQWNDALCAGSPIDPFNRNRSDTENLFWISSPAYWKNKSSVQYHSVMEETHDNFVKLEPMTDVVTDFFFDYQLNIPLKSADGRSSNGVLDIYPVLLTVSSGESDVQVEDTILRFILYPKGTVVSYMEVLGVFMSVCLLSGSFLLVLFVRYLLTHRPE